MQPDEQNYIPIPPEDEAEQRMRRLSRRGLLWAAVSVGGTYSAFHWIHNEKPIGFGTPSEDGITEPFRNALSFDDRVTSALYSPSRLSPTYSDSAITEARQNGDLGLTNSDDSDSSDSSSDASSPATENNADSAAAPDSSSPDSETTSPEFDPKKWELKLIGAADPKIKTLTIEDIKAFPKQEFVTEFKCIEGWSFFMKWAGTRFSDFYAKYPPAEKPEYLALETPDGKYYVSIDLPAALHPQTLLCYEMNGKPLALEHGAPLRLILPHKYGVKNIKRIGTLRYASTPPKDYWAEQGYDYYAGL